MRLLKMSFSFLMCIFYGLFVPANAQVKITDGALLTMDPNSLLELESTNKGLLVPRIALNNLNLPAPLIAPVPQGMLVYSTGGTVAAGFYYWDSAKWERVISTGTNILQTVTKSVNSALSKTDNIVLARNDISLTLPAVTSADDGLAITIENVGTYMDVVTVTGATGSELIDLTTSSTLYGTWGRTYIAFNGNWMRKENLGRADNVFEVSEKSSWTTIAQAIEFLGAHMTGPSVVQIGGGTYPIAATQTINLPYPVTFKGISYGESFIVADASVSGTPLFICQTECHFKMLDFNAFSNAAGNDAIRFTDSGKYQEVTDCVFDGFNRGIVTTNNNDLWIFEIDFENCSGAGIEIAAGSASGGRLRISETDFMQCAKGINLLSGISWIVSILTCSFYNTTSGTDIAILYTPASFISFVSIVISNTAWNNQGTYVSGFDFTRPDGRDANAYIVNNVGMESKNPHCKINVVNNTTATTITTAGTFYKANWTNTSIYTVKWAIINNRITYQPINSLDAWAVITGDITVNNNNCILSIAIVKNGIISSRHGETALRTTNVSGVPFQFSTVIYIPDMLKNDYLELYVTSNNSGDLVILKDVQWFTNTQ